MTDPSDGLAGRALLAILDELQRISHPEAQLLAVQAATLAQRQRGEARCGTCLYWWAATFEWMRNNGRATDGREDWAGWCTAVDVRHRPRQVTGDPSQRQEYDMPCGSYTAIITDLRQPPPARQHRTRRTS